VETGPDSHPKILIIAAEEARASAIESLLRRRTARRSMTPDVLSAMALVRAEEVDVAIIDEDAREFSLHDGCGY